MDIDIIGYKPSSVFVPLGCLLIISRLNWNFPSADTRSCAWVGNFCVLVLGHVLEWIQVMESGEESSFVFLVVSYSRGLI